MNKVGTFDVLKAMCEANSQAVKLAPLENVAQLQATKHGTKVTIGVGFNCMGIAQGEFVGGLILCDRAEFVQAKEKLESAAASEAALLADAEAALISVKDKALLAIPAAIGFTAGDLQEIANVAEAVLSRIRAQKGKP